MEPGRDVAAVSGALARWTEEAFQGDTHWFGALWALVEGLTADQAAWRPAPDRHCVWEIVRHVTFWRRYALENVLGHSKPDIRSGSWRQLGEADDASWQADLERLRTVQEELVSWLRSQSAEALLAPNPRSEYGLFWYMLGLLNHDSYHVGQVAYVRALMDLPPID